MNCIKDEEITLQGNQQTGIANNFQIVFDRCNPDQRECKNDDEFYKWLNSKVILIRENSRKFISDKFGENKIAEES